MSTNSSSQVDYIIVGGGTAGLVVASRLSENPNVTVKVLEAGENQLDDPRVNIPALWSLLQGTDSDWKFASQPQPGILNRTISLPAGKLVGGSSALNAQALVAPSKSGIDAWSQVGNPGWDWASLSPYYRKFYTLHLPGEETKQHLGLKWIDESVRGTSGPIQASFTGTLDNPLPKAWVDTFDKIHHGTTSDPFTGQSLGAYSNIASVDPHSKTRSYAGSAYAAPTMSRPNFSMTTGANVQRILFDTAEEQAIATAVEVIINGERHIIKAAKEVILAAGVFQSPKLLEFSGIGDEKLLQEHHIPLVVSNSNVGEHLQDHLMAAISYELVEGVSSIDPLIRQEPEAIKNAQELYVSQKKGPFCVGGIGSHAYMPLTESSNNIPGEHNLDDLISQHITSRSTPNEQLNADLITHGHDGSGAYFLFPGQGLTHENEATAEHGPIAQAGNFASIGVIQTHPFSRGRSHIKSSDATVTPEIDPAYFSHPLDIEIMARHLLACDQMRHTEPLSDLFKPNGRRNYARAHIKSLEDARQYLRETAKTAYHGCGTCGMRPRESGGVVGPDLVVYGTKNLRVVDASVFPVISRGNTMSTVYAVAEKAADVIKGVI